jgi:hypothetical protein
VTINGFDLTSDVIDLSVRAWGTEVNIEGLGQVAGSTPSNHPVSSATGAPAVFTGQLLSGGSVAGSPAGTDVILFGGNFASAAALGASLHINHFGLFSLTGGFGLGPGFHWHEIGVYNDVSNNAHIADIAMATTADTFGTIFSDDPHLKVAVSDMAFLVGVNALSLTGDNIHFVS